MEGYIGKASLKLRKVLFYFYCIMMTNQVIFFTNRVNDFKENITSLCHAILSEGFSSCIRLIQTHAETKEEINRNNIIIQ
ncbi:uncharacterized protein LOC105287052 isoform X2 [Ooceraea biroi]|uniref:uncharacterized protein LOC105287052 isoform X2 n=1 Tax=Ooceraea biroi TaxID=2015173 RepID=UPI000F096311|nr:uncharacterized protein LOC105287052 isoform X2 [Ooceraea biroi]